MPTFKEHFGKVMQCQAPPVPSKPPEQEGDARSRAPAHA